jgi:hypothetical protein
MCATSTSAPCGNTGTCTMNQTCAQVAGGTACGDPASCSGGTQTSGRTCDGAGTCQPATTAACGNFVCGGATCKMTCAGDSDCITTAYCDTNHICQTKKSPGDPCGSTNECATGVCCTQSGSTGTCSTTSGCPVDAGSDASN